jgi:hypothetical protein
MTPDLDTEHLRLLTLFHYIQGGIWALTSCFFIIYIFMGLMLTFAAAASHNNHNAPPAAIGMIFAGFGTVAVILGWTWAALTIYAGRCLAQRKHHLFCLIIAGISCVLLPYGTILGILTIMVLQRPTVQAMFEPAAIRA